MEKVHGLTELDSIALKIEWCTKNFGAVHDAMCEGPSSAEGYIDALYFTYSGMQELQEELRICVDSLMAQSREERMEKLA